MEINFCEYLMNIGLINKESFSNIILEYHKNYSNNNFNSNMINTLNKFIENLSSEEKNYMSNNLVQSYLKFIENNKIKKLKLIYMIYKSKLLQLKLRYIYKWRLITILNIINFSYKNNNNNNNDIKDNKDNKDNNKDNDNFSYNIKNLKLNSKLNLNTRNKKIDLDIYKNNFLSMKIDKNNRYMDKYQILFNNYNKRKQKSPKNESSTKKHESTKENSTKKNKKNLSELQTSLALKEQKELMECTFSPKINNISKVISLKKKQKDLSSINNYYSNRKLLSDIFDKLHNDKDLYKDKIQQRGQEYEKKFREQNTFRPKIYYNSYNKKYHSVNNLSFTERQKKFIENKKKHTKKMMEMIEEHFSKLCSFVPEINAPINEIKDYTNYNMNFKSNNSLKKFYSNTPLPRYNNSKRDSPFIRLYEDSKKRNERKIEREKDYENYINDMANISCKKDNSVNYDKINELYLYKKKNDIIKKTRKKVEDEEGSTFTPNIYVNEYGKNIYSNFYERNEKFLRDKQNFIEHSLKEQNKLYNQDKFSENQKKEIINNIIKRLTNEKSK